MDINNLNSFIKLNLDQFCRAINLDKLVPELLRNQFLVGNELQMYYNLVSQMLINMWNTVLFIDIKKLCVNQDNILSYIEC